MVPFVRTVKEAQQVVELLAANGLRRGEDGLKVIMMCELPTNALLADHYLEHFDGFSIGSNDMTQLMLGLDRDSAIIARLFDERDDAVKAVLRMAIQACRKAGKYVGICGQGPSDHPDLARWLLDEGIESMSLNPDTVVETWLFLAGESPGAQELTRGAVLRSPTERQHLATVPGQGDEYPRRNGISRRYSSPCPERTRLSCVLVAEDFARRTQHHQLHRTPRGSSLSRLRPPVCEPPRARDCCLSRRWVRRALLAPCESSGFAEDSLRRVRSSVESGCRPGER